MKLLDRVKKQIKSCEEYKRDLPKYYDQFIAEQHVLFIQIAKELEGRDEGIED